jgi:pimeloyl-ACP methyl ester carboxylesterase
MRRLLPLLIVALALFAPALAGAAKPEVVGGAAHRAGGQVRGWFAFEATGSGRSPRRRVAINLGDGRNSHVVGRLAVPSLEAGARRRLHFAQKVPASLHGGRWRIRACLPGQCLRLGEFTIVAGGQGGGSPGTTPKGEGAKTAPPSSSAPISTVPTAPLTYKAGTPFAHAGGGAEYWAYVPRSYDATDQTPSTLFVWMHGCEGEAGGDIWTVDPEAGGEGKQDWLTLSLAGREEPGNECWVPGIDQNAVLAAIADFETHFNIDRRRVILGGYSSGGDLAYRTAFEHASLFAGVLIENSAPFRDTGLTQSQALAAAAWKFPVVHLAHTGDETYGIEEVRSEVKAMQAAGFPVTLIERPGKHYDSHTNGDLRTLLLPHIDDGWLAPTP